MSKRAADEHETDVSTAKKSKQEEEPQVHASAPSNEELSKHYDVEKYKHVLEELNAKPWPAGVSEQDMVADMVSKVDTDAFFVADMGVVVKQWCRWKEHLPDVTPFYAVKCNPTLGMLKTLNALGASFDCASKGEIESVLSLGVDPSRIIYANPCKQISALRYAREHGVNLMTFDNVCELEKIEKYFPEAKLVMRIAPDDSHALMRFGTKFGVLMEDCSDLLEMALEFKLEVVGVSFHVGSGCYDSVAYDSALTLVKTVFDQAAKLGINLKLVDIGGGFSGSDGEAFKKFASVIKTKSAELFSSDVRFIAEPGRYFAANTAILAITVISKRTMKEEDNRQHPRRTSNNRRHYNYYIADGVYGSFNNIANDHAKPVAHLVKPNNRLPTTCTLFGPTCDSIDVIARDIQLPELKIGDWLYFPTMGAYTVAASSSFNGFATPPTHYFSSV